jgi:pSer/pThr/pTyr-binding forkhead associated (FHA) protein
MLTGRNAGLKVDLDNRKEIVIGRSPSADLIISDEFASNTHAKLVSVGDEWVLQDLNSTNGTFLDGKRVTTPMTMRAGATVRIGTTTFDLR